MKNSKRLSSSPRLTAARGPHRRQGSTAVDRETPFGPEVVGRGGLESHVLSFTCTTNATPPPPNDWKSKRLPVARL